MSDSDGGELRWLATWLRQHRNWAPRSNPIADFFEPVTEPLQAARALDQAADELEALRAYRKRLQDEALWFIAQTAPEAHLQEELRRLHGHIESEE